MSPLINKYWKGLATLTFGVGVFLLWWLVYPALTAYHEQYQLFLMDSGYIGQLLTVPDGLARCIGEYLVQTYSFGAGRSFGVAAMVDVATHGDSKHETA